MVGTEKINIRNGFSIETKNPLVNNLLILPQVVLFHLPVIAGTLQVCLSSVSGFGRKR